MAKKETEASVVAAQIVKAAHSRSFSSIYVLAGEEPYFIDLVCDALVQEVCPDEELKDFCQTIFYGLDCTPDEVVAQARLYPMMGEKQLVLVKDAQYFRSLDAFNPYFENPADFTVLVLAFRGKALDKRTSFWKNATKVATVLESPKIRDYQVVDWIFNYYKSLGLSITPDAAALLGESVGTNLTKIADETSKMLKNLPEGTKSIKIEDVERNVGVSREFSIFELTKTLAVRDGRRSMRLAHNIASAASFAMPPATALLYNFFYKVLKYSAYSAAHPYASADEKAAQIGVRGFFARDYEDAARAYPLKKLFQIISLIKEYDYQGKGGDGGDIVASEIFIELITKILC